MVLQAIRSILFYIAYLLHTILAASLLSILASFHRKSFPFAWTVANSWGNTNLFLLRWLTGIKSEVTGLENIPKTGCIIVAKHQSDWDIFAILPRVNRPAFIAKVELLNIPVFGRAARTFETIAIDRKKGGKAVAEMTADAQIAVDKGCHIIIFAEGTRKAPLAKPEYKFGAAKLYEALGVPIVPVALNSGLFWQRNSPVLWPGTAKARFLPPIMPGLTAAEAHARVIDMIEQTTDELTIEAVDAGLSRAVSPEFRNRVEQVRVKRQTNKTG